MKTETILSIIIVIGLTFKYLLHWAGGNFMLVLAISGLSFLYFPLAFYFFSNKGLKNQNLALSILGGMALSVALNGILFKIMYWQGSKVMLMIGVCASILVVLLSFIMAKSTKDHYLDPTIGALDFENPKIILGNYYKNLQIRSCIIAFMAIFFFLIPTSSLMAFQYRFDPELVRLKVRVMENPGNEVYKRELDMYEMSKY
jgi:hypothetical protein